LQVKENDFKVCFDWLLMFGSRKSRIVNMSSSESVSNGFELCFFFMVVDFLCVVVLCFCCVCVMVVVVFFKYGVRLVG